MSKSKRAAAPSGLDRERSESGGNVLEPLFAEWKDLINSRLLQHLFDGDDLDSETRALYDRLFLATNYLGQLATYMGLDRAALDRLMGMAHDLRAGLRVDARELNAAALRASALVASIRYAVPNPTPPAPPAVPSPQAPSPGIDFAALADELRKAGKPTQARLIEFMSDKPKATVQDVGEYVHDDSSVKDKTIAANAKRANDWLAENRVPLSLRVASGFVFREIAPK
jgi:hypothetical protein